jgi:hypothetical protein
LRACNSTAGHASGVFAAGGNLSAARSTGQRMPVDSRSFAASRIAFAIVEVCAFGDSSVTRAIGACARAVGEVPSATTPGTDK